MRREDTIALKILGMFVLGGTAAAAGLLGVSLLIPVQPSALGVGMAVTVAAFTAYGLVVSVRYRLGAPKQGRRVLGSSSSDRDS